MERGSARAEDAARHARFDRLIATHRGTLDALSRRMCRDGTVAKDLVQDTLERAWTKLDTLDDDGRAVAWLLRIMRNSWVDQLRRRHLHEIPLDDVAERPAAREEPTPIWMRVTIEEVRAAIDDLDEPFRTAAILHDIDGMSYDEIARSQHVPYATAATRIHRARRKIEKALRAQHEPGGDE